MPRGDNLEAAAQESHESVRPVIEVLKTPRDTRKLDDLVLARRQEKKISEQIIEELVKTFITGLKGTNSRYSKNSQSI